MMHNKTLWFASLAALCLNGCSLWLWEGSRSGEITKIRKEKDTVLAFARARPGSEALPPKGVVMLGEKYIYVVKDISSQANDLPAILNAKLTRAFEWHEISAGSPGQKHNHLTRLKSLPVKGSQFIPGQFLSSFCLRYPVDLKLPDQVRQREETQLKKLGFHLATMGDGMQVHINCLHIDGKLYARPADMQYDYRFETPLPVSLEMPYTQKRGVGGTAWRAALTPFAAAVDIVFLPVMLPVGPSLGAP